MSDEKRKVLEMLENGKITPQDAQRLLEALGEAEGQSAASSPAAPTEAAQTVQEGAAQKDSQDEKKTQPAAPAAQPTPRLVWDAAAEGVELRSRAAAEQKPQEEPTEPPVQAAAPRTYSGDWERCAPPAPDAFCYEHLMDCENVKRLDLSWLSGPVEVRFYDGDQLRIAEYANAPINEARQLLLRVQNGTVRVEWSREKILLGFWPHNKRLVVELPRQKLAYLEGLRCENISGKIYVQEVCGRDFMINSVSGRVCMGGVTAQNLTVKSTSGSLHLQDFAAQAAVFENVSGAVEAFGDAEEFRVKTVSGGLRIGVSQCPGKMTLSSASGGIALTLPPDMDFTAKFSSVSGRFKTDFAVVGDMSGKQGQVTHGTGYAKISLNTISGGIRLQQG